MMNKLILAGTVAVVSLAGAAAHAAAVQFYLGDTDNNYYDPSCDDPITGSPKVASCESHGLGLDVKGYLVDLHTGELGHQRDVKSLGHDGLGVKSSIFDTSGQVDAFGPDEALVLHFDQQVKLTKLGFSRVSRNDDAMIGVLASLDATPSPLFDFDLRDDADNGNNSCSYCWISLPGEGNSPELVGSIFLVSTTERNDDFALKYVYAEKMAPVPLPAAGWMLIAGLGGFAAMKRRKKNAA